jgi:outer membrane receptor protein involved in Fe transport
MVHYDDSKLGSLGLYSGDVADRSVNLPLDDARVDDKSLVANLKIDWRAASGTFTSLSSYFDRDRKRDSYDQINSVVNSLVTAPFFGFFDESFAKDRITQDQFSQEFRYVSQFDGSFQFTAGAFYKDFTFETRDVDVCTDTNLILGLPDRCTVASLEALGFSVADVAISNTGEQLSAFFELEYAFTDRLKLIGGLRWHNEDLKAFSPETTTLLGFSPFPLPEVSQKVTIDKILPMVALDFRVNDDILTYGKYSTGARNGNINSTVTLALMEIFAPGSTAGFESYGEDSTETFEVGMKSQFADGRVTFNAAAWYTDYSDLQVVVAVPPLGFGLILNASKASSKGVEFDLFASPTDNLTLFGGGSYVSSELDADLVTNLLTGAVTPKGTALPFAPKWSWSGGAEYIWPMQSGLDFYLNGNFSYTGKMKNSLAAGSIEIGDFWLLGAGLGVRADQWSLDLLVTNLTDESEPVAINNFDAFFEDNVGPLPDGFTFNEQFMIPPRTIRLILRYRF